jgi:transaldolase
MMMKINEIGYSLWLDFVERDFLRETFPKLIEEGAINGATSNPSIFANAIVSSPAYAAQLEILSGASAKAKYEALAMEDIRFAALALRRTYDQGNEGYISIEVDPFLANDTAATLDEARRLFKTIDQPNVMIKVPATEAGYPVMEALLRDGISVNATLVFSPEQAKRCLKVMKVGMDEFGNTGGERVEAVISVFVSRFDRMLDATLADKGLPVAQTGIMNAAKIYYMVEQNHTPGIQTLFASTGVKGDDLPVDYYVQKLCAPHSVNTAPLTTIQAALASTLPTEPHLPHPDEIEAFFAQLTEAGIDMTSTYAQLLDEGIVAFEEAFSSMLKLLEKR